MADDKPTSTFYQNLGGINEKASEYSISKAQFLNIRNFDFNVPNALSKRPGSTQAVTTGTSGPINSIFEFQKLTGESYVIAGSDTAMFYLTSNAYTTLSSGWSNGQPTDMLTFVNKLWMANGQKYQSWDGITLNSVGLPCPEKLVRNGTSSVGSPTYWLVAGATVLPSDTFGNSGVLWGVWAAYSFVRQDGYFGPVDFYSQSINVVQGRPATTGADYFGAVDKLFGFTIPSGYGITAVAIWIAFDVILTSNGVSNSYDGVDFYGTNGLGKYSGDNRTMGGTLAPNANFDRFYLFTLVPLNGFTHSANWSGQTYLSTTFQPIFSGYTGVNPNPFSLMSFCWFQTNTPKYLEQNQNVMFMGGFSNTPSTVWFSEVGSPEDLEPDYNFEVRTNDGDKITGMKAYNDTVVVTKEKSFAKIIGSTPEDLSLVELSQEYGCLSNKTIVQFKEKLLWLDRQGVLEYNGSSWDIISIPVEDTFRTMNLSAARENAVAVHHIYRNQIWFGIPVNDSTTNNLTVVYDYLVGGWTFFDGYSASSYALVKGSLSKPTVWRGDYSGKIHYFGESFFGDNGNGITSLAFTHFDKSQENETNLWRRFFLDVATVSGLTGAITGKVYSDYDRSTVRATYSMFQSAFQSRAEMGVGGKAVATEFAHHSASLPLLINGYSWAKRFLRNV